MKIPKQFTIHGHIVKVIQKDLDNPTDNRLGYYSSIEEEIVIFNKAWSDGVSVNLTDTQILCTFIHELIHCLQYHIEGESNERDAQSYAGLVLEFIQTSNIFDDER